MPKQLYPGERTQSNLTLRAKGWPF